MLTLRKNKNFNKVVLNHAIKKGWCTCSNNNCFLKKERNRSNRMDIPVSFILLDFTKKGEKNGEISEKEYASFIKIIINIITDNTRDYDTKCFINYYKIGIILINTPIDDAKLVIEKITNKIYQYYHVNPKEKFITLFRSVTISSYPLDHFKDCVEISGSPAVITDLKKIRVFSTTDVGESKKHSYRYQKTSQFHINWDVIMNPSGLLAWKTPVFWDILNEHQKENVYKNFKKLLDIVGAVAGLILFSPFMILIALTIILSSKGPVFYKQKRLGYLGKSFTFIKFRTMKISNDDQFHKEYVTKLIKGEKEANLGSSENPLFKIGKDPRITWIGHILRKTSLDELPQFFNVLIGTMSLVGPRPPIGYEVENYKNWHLRRVIEVKPGITGLWQVEGRSRTTFNEMVRLDLYYIQNRSILLDLKIILKTFGAMFNTKGAL